MTLFDNTDNTSHTTLVTGLNPGTTYNYYIKCQDPAGNLSDEGSLNYSVAPLQSSGISLANIKIKINRAVNKFKDTVYVLKNKFKIRQRDSHLANGTIKIYKGHHLIDTILADAEGAWSKLFKLNTKKTITIKMYDNSNNLLDSKKATVVPDTEAPKFTEFPGPALPLREEA